MAMRALPGPVQELWNVWKEIEGSAAQPITLGLVAESGPERDHWRDALLIGSRERERLQIVEPQAQVIPACDLYLVIVTSPSGSIMREMPVLERLASDKLMIAVAGLPEHQAAARERDLVNALQVELDQVVAVGALKDLAGPFAVALFDRFSDAVIPLARQFPLFRSEAANQEMQATAKQNGLVGVLPVPGADMPIMTANQVKMVLRMAAMYDLPMSVERVRELFAVVGGGFALRTVARQLVKFIPGPGWLVGGAIGYTGTFAMGRAAIEYFRRTSDALPAREPEAIAPAAADTPTAAS